MQRGSAQGISDDAEFFAQLSEHPTRQEIQRARTTAQLAAVADRLLAWQEDLVLREHALLSKRASGASSTGKDAAAAAEGDDFEADFTLVGRRGKPAAASAVPTSVPATTAAAGAVAKTPVTEADVAAAASVTSIEDDDGFCMVKCSSEDMAAALRDALRPGGGGGGLDPETPKTVKKKKPFMCSEEGCMRFVLNAEDALHKCADCGHIFCAEHSSRLSVIFQKPASSIFAPAPADGPARNAGPVAVALCEDCLERRKFHPGVSRDRTATFFAMRAVALNKLDTELTEWKESVSPAVSSMICGTSPAAAGGGPAGAAAGGGDASATGIGRFLSSLVLTAKDTWTTCAGCGMYFDRLTMKHTCVLCKRVFCSQCGLVSSTMNTVMLLHILGLGQMVPKVGPSSSIPPRLELKVCHRCDFFYKRMRIGITLPLAVEPPAWIWRYEECQRIADGCAQTLALVTSVPPDQENSALGLGPSADPSAPRVERLPNDQASKRLCESVSAMLLELEEACSWLANLANAATSDRDPMDDPPSHTEIILLKNIRRRFFNNITSCKAQLVSVRAQLALDAKKQQPQHVRSVSAAATMTTTRPTTTTTTTVPAAPATATAARQTRPVVSHVPSASQSSIQQRPRQPAMPQRVVQGSQIPGMEPLFPRAPSQATQQQQPQRRIV